VPELVAAVDAGAVAVSAAAGLTRRGLVNVGRDLWMRCYTQEEIGAAVGLARKSIDDILAETADLPKAPESPAAQHAVDFELDQFLQETADLPELVESPARPSA
jgi:hypothetical protein